MAAIMEAGKCRPIVMPVATYVQDRRAMTMYWAEQPQDANVEQYKKLKDERVHVLQDCIQEVVSQCAIEAGRWATHAVDNIFWRHTLWMADLRTVVIGNISLECCV